MIGWLRDTLGMYGRALVLGGRLLVGNPVLVIPALAFMLAPVMTAVVFGTLLEFGLRPDPKGTDADLFDFPGSYSDGTFDAIGPRFGKELLGPIAARNGLA